ncbi:MAG: hypothetical protein AAGG08_02830, partial [Actinomycetota bacterium]
MTMARTALRCLTLSHFRSYVRAEVDTDGRSVALYGPDGLFEGGVGTRVTIRPTDVAVQMKTECNIRRVS